MASGTIWLDSTRESLEGRINWSSSSLGSERNASTVYAELQMRRNDGYTTTGTWNGHLEIGGDDRDFSWYGGISSDWVTVISFSIERGHDSDGKGRCYIGGKGNGPSGTSMNNHYVEGSEEVTLDTIPRYVTGAAIRVLEYDLNKVEVKWYADQICSQIKYGTSSGSMTQKNVNTNSSTFVIDGLTPNTQYTIYFNAKRKDSGLYLTSNITIKFTTEQIAMITDAPDTNIGDSQTITWTNPSAATTSLALYQTDGETLIEDFGTVTGGSVTITPNASILYNLTPNSNTYIAKYKITSTQNGSTYSSYKDCIFIVTNSNPILPSSFFRDTITTTNELTGSNVVIKKYSGILLVFFGEPTAQNGATIESYSLTMGTKSMVRYSSTAPALMRLENIDSETFKLTVTDSRGNASSVEKTYPFLDYFDLNILNLNAERTNQISEQTTLTFNGTFWNDDFGSVVNSLKKVSYQYKEVTNSTYGTEIDISANVSGNNFSNSLLISGDLGPSGFDVSKSYDIKLLVEDELSSYEFETVLASGTPALAILGGNKIAQGRKYDTTLGGDFQMNGTVYLNGESLLTENDIEDSLTSISTTKALSAKQGKILNEKVPEIITGYISRKSFTVPTAWASINLAPFDGYTSTTNRITVQNNGLKIGAGVSKILISGFCRGINHGAFPGDKVFSIYKNGIRLSNDIPNFSLESYMTNQGSWCEQSVSPALVTCQENDVFSLYLGSGDVGTGELLGECLTIQIIE